MKKTLLLLLFIIVSVSVYAQTNVTGVISVNTTWEASKSPYNVTGNITVNSGTTLVIEPGVTINYIGNYRISVRGAIISNGNSSNPIIFNGNTTQGTEKMILFRSANLTDSSFNFCKFSGPQHALQLTLDYTDTPNTGNLLLDNCNFANTGILTKGSWVDIYVNIVNSTFDNCNIIGEGGSEGYQLSNCKITNSSFNLQYLNFQHKILNSVILNTGFVIGGQRSPFIIENSKIFSSRFSGWDGNTISFNKSIIVDTPITYDNKNIEILNSVISYDGIKIPVAVTTNKLTFTNSIISGNGAGTAFKINGNATSSIYNSIISDNTIGVSILSLGSYDFQNNNFVNNKKFAIENNTNRDVEASNNYWGTSNASEIEALIYHNIDNDNLGTVTFLPFKTTANPISIISYPINVAKKQVGNDVVLSWSANTETNLAGYKLYYGNPTGLSYENVIDLGNVTTYTIVGGSLAIEYALTAYNANITGTNDQINGFESWFTVAKDPKVSLSYTGGILNEKSGTVKVYAQLSTALPYATTIELNFTGTALKGVDYQSTVEQIIIPAGSISNFVELTLLEDQDVELTETIIVEITAADNATIDGVQKVTLTVENLNLPTISLAVAGNTITEQEYTVITATLNASSSKDIVVDLKPIGTALYGVDFSADFVGKGTATTVAGGNGQGGAMNELNYPSDVSLASDGTIYLLDSNNGRIQKWEPGATVGTTVTYVSGISRFSVDTSGNIYGLDSGNHRIQKWTVGGTTWTTVAGGNGQGSDPNQFSSPQGFCVDTAGTIFVADYGNQRIQKWVVGALEGKTVAGGNGQGSAADQLNYPYDVSVSSNGTVFISDPNNNRIQKWAPGATIGTTVTSTNGIYRFFIDPAGTIYGVDQGNHRIQKWAVGGTIWSTVAGGNGLGNKANQLNNPQGVYVGPNGNIYVADAGNHRIQKVQYAPQLTIKAGDTQAEAAIKGITDFLDEDDESILLEKSSTNAVLNSTSPILITLTDLNEAPVVSLALSQPAISENSLTDVTLTATLSVVSGKNVTIAFTTEGTAVESQEYVVNSKLITIPAGQLSGSIIISTKGIDDEVVEIAETILFKISTISNATSNVESITLNLESDDDPNVSITVSKNTIPENESSIITATLDAATSKDVIVGLKTSGTAKYNIDYTSNTIVDIKTVAGGNTAGTAANQLNTPHDVFVDASGNTYVADTQNNRIQKWTAGAVEGITVAGGNGAGSGLNQLNSPQGIFGDTAGNIFVADTGNNRIQKWIPGGTSGTTIAGGNGAGNNANQLNGPVGLFVNTAGDIYIADGNNHRIQLWKKNNLAGTTVAGLSGENGTTSNKLSSPRGVFVDGTGIVYVADTGNNRIQKWEAGSGTTVAGSLSAGAAANQFHYPFKVFVDIEKNLFVADFYNSRIQKWLAGATSGLTVAGGTESGQPVSPIGYPFGLFVDQGSNIYIADGNNHRVVKYQFEPQLIVKAGSTQGSLTFSGIADQSDEEDETIILEKTVANGKLSDTAAISIALTDINNPPSVSFSFSAEKITENSITDVTLTAALSAVSGKDISIAFDLEGVAKEIEEYVVSSKSIIIPAGQSSGAITISTKNLDDALVEVLESIVFKVNTIINATATEPPAVLLLESDDNPKVSFVIDKTTIAEHESALITATLEAPASKDAIISFNSTGIAKYDVDYTTTFEGKGTAITVAGGNTQGSDINQLSNPYDVSVASDGTVYVLDYSNYRIQKWEPGAISGGTVTNLNNWVSRFFIDTSGNIYVADPGYHRVQKWTKEGGLWSTVAGGNGEGSASNKLSSPVAVYVDAVGNIFVADQGNHRIQKWSPGATEGITVAGGNGAGSNANQLYNPYDVSVTPDGTIYVLDTNNGRIQKWTSGAAVGTTAAYLNSGGVSKFFVDELSNIYTVDPSNYRIQKWASGGLEWTTVVGSNGEVDRPNSVFVDKTGNIYVSDSYNHRVQKYQNAPQIIIKAGNTSATITVKGIEDFLNDEGDETLILKMAAQNVNLDAVSELNLLLLDNKKTLTLNENPFMGLSNGAVAWGDFDLDGDQDVAIMGQGPTGAVTAIFENVNGSFVNMNQNFSKLYGGDISWVDLNKDGWIDLVVSGFSADLGIPQTKVYLNMDGQYFDSTEDYGLPQLASTKMAWGDLDNDGGIDLAISGLDNQDNYVFSVYYRENNKENFIKESQFMYSGFINGDLKIVDVDLDGDNDIVFNGKTASGSPTGGVVYNSYVRSATNYFDSWNFSLENSTIEVNKFINTPHNSLTIISSGVNSNGDTVFYSNGGMMNTELFPKLKDGDISIGDFDNDGLNDIIFTGEDKLGNPITKLFIQDKNGNFKESEIQLKGLRKSTAHWVDYDTDGDLDLFLTGIDSQGAKTLLYKSEIINKQNTAPAQITGLIATDLGNGKMRFSWEVPKDDFSSNLGYVLRLGTTPGGTELSNTESDVTTGRRLITKPAAIYTNFFETQLDPGHYYWAVQAVDTGLKGGSFSNEEKFTLTYEWKILNQGGIVDKSINGVKDPVLKLVDVDNDNDLDLVYGSKTSGSQLLKYDSKRLVNESSAIQNLYQATNVEVGDINGDGFSDILVNRGSGTSYLLSLFLSSKNGYSQIEVGEGLYKAKSRIVDLNNDGQADIILAGMTNDLVTGRPKFLLYEYIKGTFKKTDISSQIDPLKNASIDLGDVDNDQDIDFIVSGYNDQFGTQSFLYKNITILGGLFKLEKTQNNFVGVDNGTTNLIDYDSDGDLDAIYTGTSPVGDVFEIYMNQYKQGKSTWPKLNNMGLTPMREGKIDLGDFNGDGYSDLLFSGVMQGEGNITKLSEYIPATKKYVPSSFDVSDIMNAEVEFGDLDGDGDLDFVIAGQKIDKSANIFRTYINVRNDSAKVLAQASGSGNKVSGGKAMKATSELFIVNEPPSIPTNDKVQFLSGTESQTGLIPVELSWLAATDDHTPTDGLSYAIKVGTTPGGEEIMSSNANTNGMRKTGEKGNAEHNLKWRLSLPIATYYYSVQAIDASYAGSEFSTPVQFKVTALGIDSDSDGDGIENALDQCPSTPQGDAVDLNGCSVNALLGDSNGDSNVNILDLVVNVDYILGNNPIPFVFKAADVNRDSQVNVLDIVGTVDIILTSTNGKLTVSGKKVSHYPNTTLNDALFYWEGKDLYVSSNESIGGLQLVLNSNFEYKIADELLNFDWLNFKKGEDQTIMMYSFTSKSIKPGRTKLLTKLDNNNVVFTVEKAVVGTPKGLKLEAKYRPNVEDTQTSFFAISPNPSGGFINLTQNLPEQRDKVQLNVFNINGSLVWSREEIRSSIGKEVSSMNLDFLGEGIYLLVIETFENGELREKEVKRILIRK